MSAPSASSLARVSSVAAVCSTSGWANRNLGATPSCGASATVCNASIFCSADLNRTNILSKAASSIESCMLCQSNRAVNKIARKAPDRAAGVQARCSTPRQSTPHRVGRQNGCGRGIPEAVSVRLPRPRIPLALGLFQRRADIDRATRLVNQERLGTLKAQHSHAVTIFNSHDPRALRDLPWRRTCQTARSKQEMPGRPDRV